MWDFSSGKGLKAFGCEILGYLDVRYIFTQVHTYILSLYSERLPLT